MEPPPAPGAPPSRRPLASRFPGTAFGIVLLAGLLLGATLTGFALGKGTPPPVDPTRAARAFVGAAVTGDCDTVWRLLSFEARQAARSPHEACGAARQLVAPTMRVAEVRILDEDADSASVAVDAKEADVPVTVAVDLVWDDAAGWLVDLEVGQGGGAG